jgi:Methyltransferase domain
MASLFPPESFDGIYSLSVFEHLLMPWAVAVQMNRILKPGGLGYVFTHQTLGIHDAPWDFWRFSDMSWEALFNAHTGFEILDRAMDRAHFVLPFIWRPDKAEAEHSAGFEGSAVLVRKTGPCRLSWPMTPVDVTTTMYPTGTP